MHDAAVTLRSHSNRYAEMATKRLPSSVADLPLELMRDLISFTVVSADQRPSVMILSQVSQRFRLAVLDLSWLFTEADWNNWPSPFLDLWCQRARIQPLTVYLTSPTVRRLSCGVAPELKALLESSSQRWGTLRLNIDSAIYSTRFVGELLHHSFPSLQTLNLGCNYHSSVATKAFHLQIDRFPLLRALHLDGIWPDFSDPASVTELAFNFGYTEDWSRRLHIVQSCHLIQRLTVDFRRCNLHSPFVFPDPATKAILPSLIYLELREIWAVTADVISQFLCCCDVPNLESLVIRSIIFTAGVSEDLCQSMVRS